MPLNWTFTFAANDLPSTYIPNLNLLRTNAQAVDAELVAARGASSSLAANLASVAVVDEPGTARTIADSDAGTMIRWSAAVDKALTIDTGLTPNRVFAQYNPGPGNLTLVAGVGMTVVPPAGGTLVVPAGGLAVFWITTGTLAEVAGVTTAAA